MKIVGISLIQPTSTMLTFIVNTKINMHSFFSAYKLSNRLSNIYLHICSSGDYFNNSSTSVNMKIDVLALVLLIITETLQFSDGEILSLALCRNAAEVNYESYTDIVIRSCGCANWETCIRKCCQKGYSYEHSENSKIGANATVCTKHESNSFSVPIYDGTEKVRDETDNFLIGMLNCSNANLHYFRSNESDAMQKIFVQENGSLHYPNGDVIVSNERYSFFKVLFFSFKMETLDTLK